MHISKKRSTFAVGLMIRVVTYDEIDRTAWQELVRKSKTGTWFQSPEAYDFYASLPDVMEPFVFGVTCDGLSVSGNLRAVGVGYVTKERNSLKQFFTRRAIINGGVCLADDIANEEVKMLLVALREYASTKAIYLETRNFNDYSRWKEVFGDVKFAYKPHLNFHVATQGFEERLSDNRIRQVRKSKELANSELANSESDICEWYEVLKHLYRTKVKTPLFPIEFFLSAYRRKIGQFLLVKHAGRVIGGSMVVQDEKCVYEWFECGLNAEYKDQYPSVLATYFGIDYAHRQGCARYDMMGAGEPNVPYGVRDFKAEFGGQLVEHGRFLHVCRPWLYRIGALGVRVLKRK